MKIFLIIIIVSLKIFSNQMESEIFQMIQDIRKERPILKITKQNKKSLKNPFFKKSNEVNYLLKNKKKGKKRKKRIIKKRRTIRKPKLILETIFDKRAKISGRWYRQGDFVKKYKILKINYDYLLIKYKNRQYELRIHKNTKHSIFLKAF